MEKHPQQPKQIDTDDECRQKAEAWATDEDADTSEALFHYLLIRARCQRNGNFDVLQHVNSALKLYADIAEVIRPTSSRRSQDPASSEF